ncbi:hypothetical protein CPB86DRAFT_829039 [Serendipita vermifera]|nr:hypothetical protein CPB86DRAFT_829039 [Serendipita vermifera]
MSLRPFQVLMGLLLLVPFRPIAVEGRPLDLKIMPRVIQVDDPSLPPALDSICPGGLNATTVESSEPFGTGGVVVMTGFCNPTETSSENDIVPELAARQVSCPTAPNNCVSRFGTAQLNQIVSPGNGCSQKMIYDWPDWAGTGSYLAWNCQVAQNARGGICIGDTGLYQSGTHDFFVQV